MNEGTLLCEPVDGVCRLCGRPAPPGKFINCRKKKVRGPRVQPRRVEDCVHLDLSVNLGETKPSGHCGCSGPSGLYQCDLFGAVATFCIPADSKIPNCRRCKSFESAND